MVQMYRAEIDGMRALAVIPVILFHAGFPLFTGGYVGVDVFFVISGYLITSIILADTDAGTFSLLHFYERRARRILPALFFVLLCCLPLAYLTMMPSQLKEFAEGLISITVGSSNILFMMKDNYFGTSSDLNPLVHTWSLAVEEQFYVLFPLLFVLLGRAKERCIIRILKFAAILSLFLAQWSGNFQLTPPFVKTNVFWFSQSQWASFYLPTGRVWELMLGTLSAFYLHRQTTRPGLQKEVAAVTGVGLILLAVFLFDKTTPFPSIYALLPTFGAVLIILYGDKDTYIGRFLSMRIFVGVGVCSYSAYLWHQPLLVFARISSENAPSPWKMSWLIVLAFMFAYFNWRYIEKPFRNKNKFSRRQVVGSAFVAGLFIDLIAVYVIITDGAKGRSNPIDVYLQDLNPPVNYAYLEKRFYEYPLGKPFDKYTNLSKLIIIGDSAAQDFVNMAAEHRKFLQYQVRVYYIDWRCQIYKGDEDRSKFIDKGDIPLCYKKHEINEVLPLIKDADIIILAGYWKDWSSQRLPATITALNLHRNQRLFVIGGKHFGTIFPKLYIGKPSSYRLKVRNWIPDHIFAINTLLERTLDKSIFVNIHKMVCGTDGSCPLFTPDEKMISFDGPHLTEDGARYIGGIIFNNPPLNILT